MADPRALLKARIIGGAGTNPKTGRFHGVIQVELAGQTQQHVSEESFDTEPEAMAHYRDKMKPYVEALIRQAAERGAIIEDNSPEAA